MLAILLHLLLILGQLAKQARLGFILAAQLRSAVSCGPIIGPRSAGRPYNYISIFASMWAQL